MLQPQTYKTDNSIEDSIKNILETSAAFKYTITEKWKKEIDPEACAMLKWLLSDIDEAESQAYVLRFKYDLGISKELQYQAKLLKSKMNSLEGKLRLLNLLD